MIGQSEEKQRRKLYQLRARALHANKVGSNNAPDSLLGGLLVALLVGDLGLRAS